MCDQDKKGMCRVRRKSKKHLTRTAAALFTLCVLTVSAGGCAGDTPAGTETEEGPVEIPLVFLIDPATGLSSNQDFVERFNARYEGEYFINVEWLTESTAGYREKLKQWNVLDEMPVIITDAGFDYDFYRVLAENDRLVDLKPYMEQSSEWKQSVGKEMLKDCTEETGEIYLSPLGSAVQSYAGIIYNKELLAGAGYETFPDTWDEFWQCMDDLAAQGIMPLSLHGSGSYWVPMLFATAYLYGNEDGSTFLDEDFPASYENESMEQMMEMLKRMYQYTFEDAVEVDYDEAAKRFLDGKAAVFANGYWMFGSMPDYVKEKMEFAPFPGNILMNSPRMTAWAVTVGYDEEVTEGAVKVLEFRIQCDKETTDKLMKQKDVSALEQSYIQAAEAVSTVMPNYQMKWEQEIQNDFFTEYIPQYLDGTLSTEEFLERMDERLEEIEKNK